MKYYLIAGEASGDLHASRLMRSLKAKDPEAEFRYFGGDLMAQEGGTLVKHYRELAYMGFIPVLMHLRTILRNMKMCKKDIVAWRPDAVILVDYPGFNLSIAKFVHKWRGNLPSPATHHPSPATHHPSAAIHDLSGKRLPYSSLDHAPRGLYIVEERTAEGIVRRKVVK